MPCPGDDARGLIQMLGRYRDAPARRSVLELAITAAAFMGLWALMWAALGIGYWLSLLLALPTAGFLMRLFIIQHDCGHGAFFRRGVLNDWIGRVLGVLTLTPYDVWRRSHACHHAAIGNLDRRGVGDVDTLTVTEYLALSRLRRFGYRLYRHPLVLFGLGPAYLFLLRHRLPIGLMREGGAPWISAMGTNAAILAVGAGMAWLVGLWPFLLLDGPVVLIAASFAVWLFFIQHQFEHTSWARDGDWAFPDVALHGSSHYSLPPPLAWLTGNIGVHHIHHLCSRIPFYRLPQVLRDHPELAGISRLTVLQSLRCATLSLWDEGQRRLISFRELHLLAGRPD